MSREPAAGDARPGRAGPLRLRDMGAFHVGGREIELRGLPPRELLMAEGGQPVRVDPNGHYRVEQMYAQYFLADPAPDRPPILFWHGGGMTGAAWETTPDGRSGWLHYFVRRGWDCYLCDAVERGRSGFARVPEVWPEAPVIQTAEDIYERFRIGQPGKAGQRSSQPYANTRFPVEAFDSLVRQMVPRWTSTDAAVLAGYLALLEKTGPAIVVCHSQAGVFGLRAAHARPDLVRAVVALEPASIPALDADRPYRVPTLVVMGDNMDTDPRWPRMRARVRAFASAHGDVRLLSLPERGIAGNSHMLMMDRNSLDIADLVHDWLAQIG
ncbi:alpha/beta fold hydrolase [Pigmentiphaga sp.]|uniref:alpha/beta fold hydrolase n=1 Tax=Pigmentiphaga sp. TaxID=1977564 RepID=UPI0025EC7C28|nr:alpha/beta fold hydrolase [Pigmentiphaga sp.]